MRGVMTGLALSALVTAAPEDHQGPERLAVLPVLLSADAVTSARAVFDDVDRASQLRPGLRVMSIDDYYFHEGQALAKRALACGSDMTCTAKQLEPFAARLGLVVVVNGELDPPLVSLVLLDSARGAVAAQWAGQVGGGRSGVQTEIVRRTAEMLEGQGFVQHGRLKVRVRPDEATVQVDAEIGPDLGTPDTFTLAPGPHDIVATAAGHTTSRATATVLAGQETEVTLELEPSSSVWSSPWLWVGLGAVVAGAAAATAVVVSGQSPTCLCVQTRDMMDCSGCP